MSSQRLAGSAGVAVDHPSGPTVSKRPALSPPATTGITPKVAAPLLGPPRPGQQWSPMLQMWAVPMHGNSGSLGEGMVAQALSQQSFALTQLVAHLAGGILCQILRQVPAQ